MGGSLKEHSDFLTEHFAYELKMLQGTYVCMRDIIDNNWSVQEVVYFALLESFCIHARALIEFYSKTTSTSGNSVVHYVNENYSNQSTAPDISKKYKGQLNNRVAHLMENRTSSRVRHIDFKDCEDLLRLLCEETRIFKMCLKPQFLTLEIGEHTLPT